VVTGLFGAIGVSGALIGALCLGSVGGMAERGPGGPSPADVPPLPAARRRGRPARGASVGGASSEAAERRRVESILPGARWAAGALVAASALWAWIDLSAARDFRSALDAFGGGDPAAYARAADDARRAVRLDPLDDSLENLRARVLVALATLVRARRDQARALAGEARAAATRAIALAPLRASNHFTLSRALYLEVQLGDTTAAATAAAALDRGFALAPTQALAMIDGARDALAAGRPVSALSVIERAAALYPDQGPILTTQAAAWFALGNKDRGRELLRRSLDADWHGNLAERDRIRGVLESLR